MRNKGKAESQKLKAKNKKGKGTAKNKIKTDWDLSRLYKSGAELDRHLGRIEKTYLAFEKKYRGKDFTSTEEKLLRALKDRDALLKIAPERPGFYLGLSNSLDSADQKIESKLNLVSQKLTDISNRVIFFRLQIGKIDKARQRKFLKSDKLKDYRYELEKTFELAKHQLTEKEEQVANLLSLPAGEMWVRGVEKSRGKLEVEHKKKKIPLTEALEMTSDSNMPVKERRALFDNILEKLMEVADFSESEMNALVTGHKIEDKLRGFEKPYSSTILSYENTEEEVLALIETITKNFKISHKFYELKKEYLKLKEMLYADRLAGVGKIKKKFDFASSAKTFVKSLEKTDPRFLEIFEEMLEGGQIDVYPKKGKRGGAFCSSASNLPTFVLLNHADDFKSAGTLAHEMGHAIHYELSKSQPVRYQDFTISVAEVASTFFENILFEEVYQSLNQEEKLVAMHDKLNDGVSTIFRQTAFFNFEIDLHETIREKGAMSHEEMSLMFAKHLQSYLGKDVKVRAQDGYSYIYIPHFRSMFYVYAYVYGELISSALYERYKEDKSYIKEIKKFLSAGGSRSPYDIFKDIGIDTREPRFWENGLKKIEGEMKEFEKLIKKNK